MPETREQAQLRMHMSEMRRAAHGLTRDFALEFKHLGDKIDRLGSLTAKEAKYIKFDIEQDLDHLGRSIDQEMKLLPHRLASAGEAVGATTVRAAGAARDAIKSAGHMAKEGTKNAFAAAAGVKRTPMKQWQVPDGAESPPPSNADES